jgi:hypothetical protein
MFEMPLPPVNPVAAAPQRPRSGSFAPSVYNPHQRRPLSTNLRPPKRAGSSRPRRPPYNPTISGDQGRSREGEAPAEPLYARRLSRSFALPIGLPPARFVTLRGFGPLLKPQASSLKPQAFPLTRFSAEAESHSPHCDPRPARTPPATCGRSCKSPAGGESRRSRCRLPWSTSSRRDRPY